MKMAASQSPALEAKTRASLFSALSGKSSQSLLSPWTPSPLCAHPACDPVCHLRHATHLGPPNPVVSCSGLPYHSSQGRKGGLLGSAAGWAPVQGVVMLTGWGFMAYGNPKLRAHSWAPRLRLVYPFQCLGTLPHSGTPGLPVTPGILRSHWGTWVLSLLPCLSPFQAGRSLTGADF